MLSSRSWRRYVVAALSVAVCSAAWADSVELFPEKSPSALQLQQGAKVEVDSHGNLVVDGRARFLIGTQVAWGTKSDLAPLPGFDEKLKWLYEGPIDYSYLSRVGFDTVGYFCSDAWTRKTYDKNLQSSFSSPEEEAYQNRFIQNAGVPLYVDFTCAPWSQGTLIKSKQIPEELKNKAGESSQGNHWVPYNIVVPAGRAIYKNMWAYGAQQVVSSGGNPLFYELFNEPAYTDTSAINRAVFADYLKDKFKTIDQLNSVWGTQHASFEEIANLPRLNENAAVSVEWCKFLEDAFVDLCKEGIETIRGVDQREGLRFTVQALGMDYYRVVPSSHVNLYKLSQILNATETPTGGGGGSSSVSSEPASAMQAPSVAVNLAEGILQRHFIRAISQGKPIYNGELYGNSRQGIRNNLWLDLVRGGSASYWFFWSKRAWDPLWAKNGGAKLAEQFPYLLLNPHANTSETLLGPRDFKGELSQVDDLFVPRQNRQQADVAQLFSYPTERYSAFSGSAAHNKVRSYTAAVEFSHVPQDVLLEEQLIANGAGPYRVIIAAGTENIYPETAAKLAEFVRNGGVLIAGQEKLSKNEYGHTISSELFDDLKLGAAKNRTVGKMVAQFEQAKSIPGEMSAKFVYRPEPSSNWKTLATLHGEPAVLRKSFGKGTVYYISVDMPDYALASLLGGVLNLHDVTATCEVVRFGDGQLETNVEVHRVQSDGLAGYFLYNWDKYPKLIRFRSHETKTGHVLADPMDHTLYELSDGSAVMLLAPEERRVVVAGSREQIAGRWQGLKLLRTNDVQLLHDELKKNAAAKNKPDAVARYKVDSAKVTQIDLRSFANRGFEDHIAGDGKGGWTDQGENCLVGVPWGIQDFAGVPCNIIRFDENFDKTCIVLSSPHITKVPEKVTGIPVESLVKTFYFVTAAGWSNANVEAMRYVIHYTDGSTVEVPMICGKQTGDWWIDVRAARSMDARIAWKNAESKGFYIYGWTNPHPDRQVESLDIVSSNRGPIPITVSISYEKP